jgi:adenosylcobinamide-phosphate synthase
VTALTILMALLLDRLFGEMRHFHPLVGFGTLVARLERMLNRYPDQRLLGRLIGGAAVLVLVLPLPLWVAHVSLPSGLEWGITVIFIFIAIGARSLAEHGRSVALALQQDDLALARTRVGYIVSRDTNQMDKGGVSRAAMESVLENGNDAIFGALFWFMVGGLPGVIAYRLVNTLDAMWGYRTPRYNYFGWAAARIDDVMNWIPARLTALSYALVGETMNALRCWQQQAHLCESPNAGPVMAAGAGALSCQLGGGAWYHGCWVDRPQLGVGSPPAGNDIERAIGLVERTIILWVLVAIFIEVSRLA